MSQPTPRLTCLTIPTPFEVGPVNVYLVEGEPLTLIDAGPKTEEAWTALHAELARHGYRLEDVQQVVLTHAHLDHYGLLNRVVATCGAPVYAHPRSVWWLADTPGEWERRVDFFRDLWVQCGVPADKLAAMSHLSQLGVQFAESLPPEAQVRTVDEGDTLVMGDLTWQVLHTPGHAGSHISFYEPASRQMIAGDHLLLKISSNPLLEPPIGLQQRARSLVDYIASLTRVAGMDVAVAWPGHGPPVYDHRALIATRLEHHAARSAYIASLLADGPLTAYELCMRLFPKLPLGQLFLGLSEVIGHLDVLELEGRVGATAQEDGAVRYALRPAA